MEHGNKDEAIAALHRARILDAAEALFAKGFEQTTIEDISRASGYSRRTIYAYYESKDDILRRIVVKGLTGLLERVEAACAAADFEARWQAVRAAMTWYHDACPQSMEQVNRARTARLDQTRLTEAEARILELGAQINARLERMLEDGQKSGDVRADIVPALSVYVLWSGMTALLDLAATKGPFIARSSGLTEEAFLDYGFEQLRRGIAAKG